MSIKERLYLLCKQQIQKKLDSINQRLEGISNSMAAETKSSVGDKYETGRAMLHLEKDKIMQQFAAVANTRKLLESFDPKKVCTTSQLGALVQTDVANYFLGASLGKITIDNQMYFCISTASPIGQLLLQKKAGDSFSFRGEEITIIGVK